MNYYFFSDTNASVCESFWDECDDSIFSEICDVDLTDNINSNKHVQINEDMVNKSLPISSESTTKRKYCATESNIQCSAIIKESKKTMVKKLKNNSLFKL